MLLMNDLLILYRMVGAVDLQFVLLYSFQIALFVLVHMKFEEMH